MTIHKLTHLGGRRTACALTVPPIIKLGTSDATWDDGDGHNEGRCTDGCWPKVEAPPPSSPHPAGLQRFDAMAVTAKGTTPVKVGRAVVNRDGSLNVYLDALPCDRKLTLVPA